MTESDPYLHTDAAYVLGALDPAERAAFEEHLLSCDACTARVLELQPMPALLAGLPEDAFLDGPDTAPLEPPPDTLLPGLLRRARRERARRHWLTGGLAAVAAACVLALVIAVWPASSPSGPRQQAMAAVVASPVTATVTLQAKQWGTAITVTCHYAATDSLPAGYQYGLAVVGKDGTTTQLGSWELNSPTITFPAGTSLTEDQIKAIQIVLPDKQPILQLTT